MTEYALYELESGCCLYAPDVVKRNNTTTLNKSRHSTYTEEDLLYLETCFESGRLDRWPSVCSEHKDWICSAITLIVDRVGLAIAAGQFGSLPRLLAVAVSGENDDTKLCFGHSKTDMLILYGNGMTEVVASGIRKLEYGEDYYPIEPEYIELAKKMINE